VRVGKVLEATAFGVVMLLLAVWGGQFVHGHAGLAKVFTLKKEWLAWAIIAYGFAASVLPVWLLLAPRDYLSTFVKLGTIFALALGCFLVLPDLKMPALTTFVDGSGLVVPGKLFPFCFIVIACGSISGFHALISSGTTPKLITRERYARPVAYGAMCLESLVAIMAMIAACTLDPGVYMSVNYKAKGADTVQIATNTVAKINSLGAGYAVTTEQMDTLAKQVGETTLIGRTGGAATLAVGMAHIFSHAMNGRGLDLWYHFAIMFEALFILTTLDAGTRVGRYLLHDVLGAVWKPLGETKHIGAGLLSAVLIVGAWGYFLIQGVIDPNGVAALWPIFGIANQMLAGIALCLATTIILKMQLSREKPRLRYMLITLIPLVWLLSVTLTAAAEKIWHPDARIGFIAQTKALEAALPALQKAAAAGDAVAAKGVTMNLITQFNNRVDSVVTGMFILLVGAIVVLSAREWLLLLARKRLAGLRETDPVWLPDHELAGGKPLQVLGLFALLFLLAKELSGEAALERARTQETQLCECGSKDHQQLYVAMTTRRFKGVNRCC
jgi:carbon starvation protein